MSDTSIKRMDIAFSLVAILGISSMLLLYPGETSLAVAQVKDEAMQVLSPFYLWLGLAIFLYSMYLCFSRYGSIRIGGDKAEYTFPHWFFMVFCTGMGSNMLYWSALEWMYYYQSPPCGADPYSQTAAELAVMYGGYHWGCIGWSIYAIGAVTFGLSFFNRGNPRLSLSEGCAGSIPALGRGAWARLIELCFLFGTIGGFVTMLAFVVPMYAGNLALLFGWQDGFLLQVELLIGITILFTLSSWMGLRKGIQTLSTLNIVLAILILVVVFVAGPTVFIIKGMTNSLAYGAQHFISISLWTDFVGNSGFPEAWTAFYWAWWIGLAPCMWIFTARISRGRTVREVILGGILGGSLGCWLYFGIISNFGMLQQLSGALDLIATLNQKGPAAAVAELVLALPGGTWMLILWTLTGIIFLVTTLDSGSYTLALSTSLNTHDSERSGRLLRMFWSMIILAVPLGLMYAKAPMGALQASAVLTAVPIGFLTPVVIHSGYMYLREIADRPESSADVSLPNTTGASHEREASFDQRTAFRDS